MTKIIKIAIIGLGQVGNYLYRELNLKKKNIEIKSGKKIQIIAVSAKNKNKKRKYKINKKIFYTDPINIIKKIKPDVLFEVIGQSDGISKKVVETALRNQIHVITPNKGLISKHGDYLSKLAEDNNVNLEFEASVAGGIPILKTIENILEECFEKNLTCRSKLFFLSWMFFCSFLSCARPNAAPNSFPSKLYPTVSNTNFAS